MAICGNCFNNVQESAVCPLCGYDNSASAREFPAALQQGSVLNRRFVVGRVLGQGGFGVTYLAQDYQTRERIAIKEYFPTEYVLRVPGTMEVRFHKNNFAESFETGKQQFLEEARTLAEFIGDEHIVRIYRYFEENETAYFAMEYVDGKALNKYLETRKKLLTVDEANDIFLPLMESLANVHSKGIVHRDLSPDNIIIQPDGSAKIIDFGAARYSTGEMSKSLDVVLKHGFAPLEQYTRRGRQGPFTDIYALAATYYFAITGKVPPDAADRVVSDMLLPPSKAGAKIGKKAEAVLLKALAVKYTDRFQSMTEFRNELIKACGPKKPTPEELNEAAYQEAIKLQETSRTESEYKAVSRKFEKLGDYKDSRKRVTQCSDAVTSIKEEQRKQKEEEAKRKAEEKELQRIAKTEAKKQAAQKQQTSSAQKAQPTSTEESEKPHRKSGRPGWLKLAIPLLIIAVVLAVAFGAKGGFNPSPADTDPQVTEPAAAAEETAESTEPPAEPEETEKPAQEEEPKYTAETLAAMKKVSSIVTFGSYEQDNNPDNGTEPIEWQVLDVQPGKSLLISRKGLDCQPYNSEQVNVTWETCTLRAWLNDSFLNSAFDGWEQSIILTTAIDNSAKQMNPKGNATGGKNTEDQVFVLSYSEANTYFDSDAGRRCLATDYTISQGVNLYDGCPCWWLRTPGAYQYSASYVAASGTDEYNWNVEHTGYAVRPVIWVDRKAFEDKLNGIEVIPLASEKGMEAAQTVGSHVTFGSYEQDNDTRNGKEPIEWIVLDVQEGKTLLISRYGLDSHPYSNSRIQKPTWEECTLRSWMNGTFLKTAFIAEEQAALIPTEHDCEVVDGGTLVTTDSVFALSRKETINYFRAATAHAWTCEPTAYVIGKGAYTNDDGSCWWWGRSEANVWYPVFGLPEGADQSDDDFSKYSVRPAIWVDLAAAEKVMHVNSLAYGTCGKNLKWDLDKNGTLTISGTSAMDSYFQKDTPWKNYASNIRKLVIEPGVTQLGENAFLGCRYLNSVIIPEGITSLPMNIFCSCTSLTELSLPSTLTTLNNECLWRIGIKEFTIPASVAYIHGHVYGGDASAIYVDPENQYFASVDGVLYSKNLKTLVAFPENKGTTYVIPDGTESIKEGAFAFNSKISTLTIPTSLKSIGNDTFHCGKGQTPHLKTVYYAGTEEQWKQVKVGSNNDLLLKANIIYQGE